MAEFKRPLNNRFFEWLGRTGLMPALWWNNYDGISIARSDLEKIRQLPTNRTIICSNHSHRHDPIFLFSLSAILKEQFNYIAAREIFDWWIFGLHGYCIQRVGAYSITRGIVDRASIAMSRTLILEGKRKLVVFPECEISGSDDRLLPVEPGLAGLFFRALEDVQEAEPGEPLLVLPVGLKYKYVEDITHTCSNALTRIENALSIQPESDDLNERFHDALKAFVAVINFEFRFGHANWANTEQQVDFEPVIVGLLEHAAACIGAQVQTDDAPQAVHALRGQLHEFLEIQEYISPYRRRIHRQRRKYLQHFEALFDTILRIAALKEFPVLSGLSQENLANGIDLLEREMFGKATQKGHRMVYLNVGDPINLLDRFEPYQKNKRREIAWLTEEIDRQLREMLGIPSTERKAA